MNNCTSTSQRTVQPIPSTIDNHQSPFINPAARAASKPRNAQHRKDGTANPFDNRQSSVDIHQSCARAASKPETPESQTAQPIPSTIDNHQSPFINPAQEPQANQKRPNRKRHSRSLRQSTIISRHSSILRKSRKQTRNARIANGTANPFDNRQSSSTFINPAQEPQANQKRPNRKRHSQSLRQSTIISRQKYSA